MATTRVALPLQNLTAITARAATTARASEGPKFIDVSDTPVKNNIVRGGFQVPAPRLDPTKTAQLVGDLIVIAPTDLPRVISQSVAAGTKVSAGTVIDLDLAPKSAITFDAFELVHLDLKGKSVDTISPLVADGATRKLLLTYENAQDVPAADKTALRQAMGRVGIQVDDTDPERTFERAFESTRGALAFHE